MSRRPFSTLLAALLLAMPLMAQDAPKPEPASAATKADESHAAPSLKEIKPLKVGDQAPDVFVKDLDGKEVSLKAVIGGKPTVLVFNRGGWCPYCNAQLADLSFNKDELQELGFQTISLSIDRPDLLKGARDENKYTIQVYSDNAAAATRAFGVGYRIDDATFEKYRRFGLNLEEKSGYKHHVVPAPAAFLIDKTGKIAFVYTGDDIARKISGSALVEAARAAVGAPARP